MYFAGPLRLEGRVGDSLDSDDFHMVEARGTWSFGSAFSARATYQLSDYSEDRSYRVFTLGGAYDVDQFFTDLKPLFWDAVRLER